MNNLPVEHRKARLELKYKLEGAAEQGDLRTLLGTALELQHIAGIQPHSIEYITYTDDGPVYEFIDFSPRISASCWRARYPRLSILPDID